MLAGSIEDKSIAMRTYEEVRAYLYGLRHHGAKYGIDRMVLLSELIGHPERDYPVIHVAGTNGKGSTCAMLESIYRRCGYKTGLFTSPHLVYQGERVQVNRRLLDRESIIDYTNRLRVHAEALAAVDPDDHPSFFELITAMAFMRFSKEEVDIGIIETGLGGRRDASNIVDPEISIITSVSLDHCDILGHTLEAIAAEKGGIIKEGKPVILGRMPSSAEGVLRGIAREKKAEVHSIRERFGFDPEVCPTTNLHGNYQRWNAATATLVVETLHDRIPVDPEGVSLALDDVYWPGRWDSHQVGRHLVYLDTSHNPEGVEGLAENLGRLVSERRQKPVILAGTLGHFRASVLMPVVARFAERILLLKPAQPRAASFQMLRDAIPSDFSGSVVESSVREIFPFPGLCTCGEPDDVVVATGSIYLIGEILEALNNHLSVGEHLLQ